MITENYLDEDVAYLLGLIVMRGELYDRDTERGITIEFPFKSLEIEGYEQNLHLQVSVSRIRERIQGLVESVVQVEETRRAFIFTIRFFQHPVAWRNLRYLLGAGKSYRDFHVPPNIMLGPREIQTAFVRGIADVGGFIRDSNRYLDGRRRVYLEVHNRNWLLPIQLCELLQQKLDVPLQLIQWGHPNTREPRGGKHWAREHQVKIFAEAFEPIGFSIDYKNDTLRKFAGEDRKARGTLYKCNPNPELRRVKEKKRHPEEKSDDLTECLRGRHFDAYWQVCLALGCKQCISVAGPRPLEDDIDEESEAEV